MAISTKWDEPAYYDDSIAGKMKYVFDKLRYEFPDIKLAVDTNPMPGDYVEFMFEGIGRLRMSNTELFTKSPQEIATYMETFIRKGIPRFRKEYEAGFKEATKPTKPPVTAADEWADEWANKNVT